MCFGMPTLFKALNFISVSFALIRFQLNLNKQNSQFKYQLSLTILVPQTTSVFILPFCAIYNKTKNIENIIELIIEWNKSLLKQNQIGNNPISFSTVGQT